MNNDEGEQQVKEEMGEAWERVTKKRKSQMSNDELRAYFDSHLRGVGECPNPSCNYIAIIADRDVHDSVVRYLCWFNAVDCSKGSLAMSLGQKVVLSLNGYWGKRSE